MFVVFSNLWEAGRAVGQERLLVDAWFELVADDASPLYWPPLCSTLQLLRNLRQTLADVNRGVLFPYQVRDGAAEILDRLRNSPWLEAEYPGDIAFLKEQFVKLRESHRESSEAAEAEGKSREAHQNEVRRVTSLLLGAFIDKVERDGPLERQRDRLAMLIADATTSFDVVIRAAAELTNDLLHLGHSREHLHRWMLNGVLAKGGPQLSYLQNIRGLKGIGADHAKEYRIIFRVFATEDVPGVGPIALADAIPNDFAIPAGSKLREVSKGRFAIVTVPGCLDPFAAIDQGRRTLTRYFASTRLEDHPFDRTISPYAAACQLDTTAVDEIDTGRTLMARTLFNDQAFYETPEEGRNEQTFGEIDRVIYWLEQSRHWDDMGRLTALWTAMEFLFSKQGKTDAGAIIETLPAYLVPQYARILVRDFASFFSKLRIEVPETLRGRLKAVQHNRGGYRLGDFLALLELAQEAADADQILSLLTEYPILIRKWRKVRRLNPTLKGATASNPDIWTDIDRFESNLKFDLQFSYRARNSIVHDAAMSVVQSDRLVQRLQWMLCAVLDALFHQFSRNPTLSITALHEVNLTYYLRWNKALKDVKKPMPLKDIIAPYPNCLT